jgi:hypothetical protein
MKLLTKPIEAKLLANSKLPDAKKSALKPVAKFFTPDANATWLISEMDEEGRMFGLCDLGLGCAELGYVMLDELKTLRGRLGLPVERDRWFKADKTLSEYANESRVSGRVNA